MSTKLMKFMEEIVDSNLPEEQQSMVFSTESIIGGVTANTGNCSNMNFCGSSDNTGDCNNYGSCSGSYNGGNCKQLPQLPPTVAKLCGTL